MAVARSTGRGSRTKRNATTRRRRRGVCAGAVTGPLKNEARQQVADALDDVFAAASTSETARSRHGDGTVVPLNAISAP